MNADDRFFTLLLDNTNDLITRVNHAGQILYVNSASSKYWGISPEQCIGRLAFEFIHPDDRQTTADAFGQWLRSGDNQVSFENRQIHVSGSFRYMHWSISIVHDQSNSKPEFLSIARDITELRQMEKALRASERKWRSWTESSPNNIMVLDLEFHVQYINHPFPGFTREQIVGCSSFDFILPCYHKAARDCFQRVISHRTPERFETSFFSKGRERRYFSVRVSPLIETDGTLVALISSSTDITERKNSEKHLQERERVFEIIFENSGTANAMFDTECRLVIQNAMSAAQLNAHPTEMIGASPIDIFGPKVGPIVLKRMRRVIKTQTSESYETKFTLPVGDKWFFSQYRPLLNASGEVEGIQIISQDITEKKKAEEALRNMQKLESLGVLAGGVAHDFNNLLSGIFGFLDIAAQDTKEPHTAVYLEKALKNMARAQGLTQQLLTFSKGGEPIKKLGQLKPFLKDTVQFALAGSNVSCEFDFPDDLWPCEYDENQIGQVFDNIVINAKQAMPNGGTLHIWSRNVTLNADEHAAIEPGDFVQISIQDHGVGIPQENLSRIFDPFYSTKSQGHGLGLATSYSIITRHGGSIDVASEQGKGSVFKISLPAKVGAQIQTSQSKNSMHRGNGVIIIMDDDTTIRDLLSVMLQTFGYTPVPFSDGMSTLNYWRSMKKKGSSICAMICDLTIPGGLGGMDVINKIREEDASLPVIVSSGYADDPVMANPTQYGFSGSIRKPFRSQELATLLNRVLGRKK